MPLNLTHEEQKLIHNWAASAKSMLLLLHHEFQNPNAFDDPLLAIDWNEGEVRNRRANLQRNLRPPNNYKVAISNAIVADLTQMGNTSERLHPPDPAAGSPAPRSHTLLSLPNDDAFQ